jgi:serine protease Do
MKDMLKRYMPVIIAIVLIILSFIYLNNKIDNLQLIKKEQIIMTNNFSENVEKIKPAIVMIVSETNRSQLPFTGGEYISMENKVFSKGTGFIVTDDGYILTANHVVKEAKDKIQVRTLEGNQFKFYEAKLISSDNNADVALLKINVKDFVHVNLGDYNKFREGMNIGFVGFPLSMDVPLVNDGIISGRGLFKYEQKGDAVNIYVINAFVNQGNSGGPVFSAETGEVIGIINARMNVVDEKMFIKYDSTNRASMSIGGVDPIALAVETYNLNLKFIGDVSQVGIGYSTSIEYGKSLLNSVKK